MADLDALQREVGEWADATFPQSALATIAAHLEQEVGEFVDALHHPNQYGGWPMERADDADPFCEE